MPGEEQKIYSVHKGQQASGGPRDLSRVAAAWDASEGAAENAQGEAARDLLRGSSPGPMRKLEVPLQGMECPGIHQKAGTEV